jgi:hypothetical protein
MLKNDKKQGFASVSGKSQYSFNPVKGVCEKKAANALHF